MGTIVHKFTNIEVYIEKEEDIFKLRNIIAGVSGAACYLGANDYAFITIFPSGSKEGWSAYNDHEKLREKLLNHLTEMFPCTHSVESYTVNEQDV